MQMIATAKIAKIKQMIGVAERYEDNANDVLRLFLKNTENSMKNIQRKNYTKKD